MSCPLFAKDLPTEAPPVSAGSIGSGLRRSFALWWQPGPSMRGSPPVRGKSDRHLRSFGVNGQLGEEAFQGLAFGLPNDVMIIQ